MSGIVISFFDESTRFVRPWLEAGYECWCVDMKHPRGRTKGGKNLWLVGADVHELHRDHWWLPPRDEPVAFFAAFTDCTFLTISAQRWQAERGPGPMGRGLLLADAAWRFARDCRCPYLIENPAKSALRVWRKPDYVLHPWEFSGYLEPGDDCPICENDAYSKETGLWVGGGFVMPERKPFDGLISASVHEMAPSDDRAQRRSVIPLGFARAIFHANSALTTIR